MRKFIKGLVCACALTMAFGVASAEKVTVTCDGDQLPVELIATDGAPDEGKKVVIPFENLDIPADAVKVISVEVTASTPRSVADTEAECYWHGCGGAVGYNNGEEWVQADFDLDNTTIVKADGNNYTFTIVPENDAFDYDAIQDAIEAYYNKEEDAENPNIMVGWWWGTANYLDKLTVKSIKITFETEHKQSDKMSYDEDSHWYTCKNHPDYNFESEAHLLQLDKEKTVPAKVGSEGVVVYNCAFCDYTEEEIKDALTEECKHTNMPLVGLLAATCTTDGYTGDGVCEDCGYFTEGKVEVALGHSYGEWVVKTPSTVYVKGVREAKCTLCGDVKTEYMDKLPKTTEKTEEKATAATAPKTGDATSVAVLAIVAMLAMGGVVVVSKKRA